MFGDVNGSRTVTGFDLNQYRRTNGKRSADAEFNAAFDANNSGTITGFDLNQFRSRNGKRLNFTDGTIT
jgi:hypothetical protein